MPNEGRRETVLNAIQNALGYIQTGMELDYCDLLPEDLYSIFDDCNSTSDWTYNSVAVPPTLDQSTFVYGTASLNLGKDETGGDTAIYEKTLSSPIDITLLKLIGLYFFYNDIVTLHTSNALQIRIGTDDSNYYYKSYTYSSIEIDKFGNYGWDYTNGDSVGSPDPSSINYISVRIRTSANNLLIPIGDAKMDLWFSYNTVGWTPYNGTSFPLEVCTDEECVQGTACIGFGKMDNTDINCAVLRDFSKVNLSYNLTGLDIETWFMVKDKTQLFDSVAPGFPTIYIIVGNATNKYFAKFVYTADIQDIVNDGTDGWNKVNYNIENDSDVAINNPDITDITLIGILVTVADVATMIPTGDLRTDFWRATGGVADSEEYNLDVKAIYRYKMGIHQVPTTPSIVMAAVNENCESKIYPSQHRQLNIGLEAWLRITDESILDKELGKFADDIQKALMSNSVLDALVRYIEIKNFEFSIKKGSQNYGVLTTMLNAEYVVNQKDPAMEA